MPQVLHADPDENDSLDEGEDEFDCFYSYLLEREQNQSQRKGDNDHQRPSLSSSTATDSSTEETGIWKTLGDAKKKQEDIRNRLKTSSSQTPPRQEQAPVQPDYGYGYDDDEENKPDSEQDLRPEDVVRMVVRKASMAMGTLPPGYSLPSRPPPPPPSTSTQSRTSSQHSETASRPATSFDGSDDEADDDEISQEDARKTDTIHSESSDDEQQGSRSTTSGMEAASDPAHSFATPSKWKKSTANIHASNFAGIVTPVTKSSHRYSDLGDASEDSDVTGITRFFDAIQDEVDILDMDENQYRNHLHKQKEEKKLEKVDELLSPETSKGSKPNVLDFPLVKPLPFIPPTFEKPDVESESEYDPEYEFQRLYVDSEDCASFDKAYYDRLYGEYNDDRDPEERERERRQKELEARKRGEAESDDDESQVEEEDEEERGLVGQLFKGVFSVGVSLGASLFGGGTPDEEDEKEEEEEDKSHSSHKRRSVPLTEKNESSMFSSSPFGFMSKKAKNPPKIGAPPPSRELEIIKKCQQQSKIREKEAAEREAKQKELDQENLRMRREEERERVKVKREVDAYREDMIAMGKGDKLAKDLKKAKDEYEDRLAMEETLKQQQQKAEEMQERLQKVDEGKGGEKKKKNDDDSDSSSEYEAGCCCVVS